MRQDVGEMSRSTDLKNYVWRLAGRSLAAYIRFVYRTSRVVAEPPEGYRRFDTDQPVIVALWHGQFMMTALQRPDNPVAAMVARHGDAELLGALLANLNVELVRGAGANGRRADKGGAHALRKALTLLAEGRTLVMTADVPPGPARQCGEGIITLARLSGRPIVPMASATTRFLALDTWSRLTINLPFSRLAYVYGEPLWVPRNAGADERERLRCELEVRLNAATQRAYEMSGGNLMRVTPHAKRPPAKPGALLLAYRGVTAGLSPFSRTLISYRARRGKEDPARASERLGFGACPRPEGVLTWVHAASVGEMNAVLPLIDGLRQLRPGSKFLFTSGTVTSATLARTRLPPDIIHQFAPLDTPPATTRFLDHWRPDLAIFVESEIWPNVILSASARAIPMVLVNARMSPRTARRWRRAKRTARALFSRFALVLAQDGRLARTYTYLGSPNVIVTGNIKLDAPPPAVDANLLARLTAALGGRPVFVAASTHEGEEAIIGEVHRSLAGAITGLCTMIVPRHPERGDDVAGILKAHGLRVAQRSKGALPDGRTDVYVADTIGELGLFYAVSQVAFIGGSLVQHGGQNPIEAVQHHAAVISGPHTHNFKEIYHELSRGNGVRIVASSSDLTVAARELLGDASLRARQIDAATDVLAAMGGALRRSIDALAPLLPLPTARAAQREDSDATEAGARVDNVGLKRACS